MLTPLDRTIHRTYGPMLPPLDLRVYYYRAWNPAVFTRSCEVARREFIDRGLRPEHRVLDIGSGIGNLALGLTDYLTSGSYDGLEIHPQAVAWCQRTITRSHPAFRFHHADLASRAYNPRGHAAAATYRFPFADRRFDFICLSSVFTHMLPEGVENYLSEIARLLAPGGLCAASFFLLNDETRRGVEGGDSFIPFEVHHASGVCRLHDAAVPEAAVAFEESFVVDATARAGLLIRDIRRGDWWRGTAHYQDMVTMAVGTPGAVGH